jgi:hypothetical protein
MVSPSHLPALGGIPAGYDNDYGLVQEVQLNNDINQLSFLYNPRI